MTTTTENNVPGIGEFHCGSEWHFARANPTTNNTLSLGGAAAAMVHSWLLRVAKKDKDTGERKIWVSPYQAALHLNMKPRMAQLAFQINRELGFFVLLESGKTQGSPSRFQILTHKEWAEAHPGQCTEKFDAGWKEQEDPLGIDLHVASDGAIKFKTVQVLRYRQTGLPTDTIMAVFKAWFPCYAAEKKGKHKHWRRGVGFEFGEHLAALAYALTQHPNQLNKMIENTRTGRPIMENVDRESLSAKTAISSNMEIANSTQSANLGVH
jgi:hypothetical protein